MNSMFIILLGCNVMTILMDRITTLIYFIKKNENNINKITLYLSGGIKFKESTSESEALIMQKIIHDLIKINIKNIYISYDFILDDKSTNTAENIYHSSLYLNSTKNTIDNIYIVTSAFHFNRASLITNIIDTSKNYSWILSELREQNSYYWEYIHIKNVYNDIKMLK